MSDMKSHDKTAARPQIATVITQSPLSSHREADPPTESRGRSTMNVALWIVQGLLAALFLVAGGAKLVLPLDQMTGPVALPGWFLRFVGLAEVLGALGLIFPGLLGIRPGLTPLAAAGLVIIMVGATVVMWTGGMVAVALMNVIVALLAAFVAYGRWRLAPYRDSSRPSVLRHAS